MIDDTAALQDQINREGPNAHIELRKGVHNITRKVHAKHQRVHLHGAGLYATTVLFDPKDDPQAESLDDGYVCFEFSSGPNVHYQSSLTDLSFYSHDGKKTKVAIDLADFSDFKMDRVSVGGSVVTPQGTCAWTGGKGSVALRTRGRELLEANKLTVSADRPIQFSKNPNNENIACDHFHFSNINLIGNGHPLVSVDDENVRITQMLFDGYQAWCLGTHGFYWKDTKSKYVSNGVTLKNVRWEQEESPDGHLVHIEHNSACQKLALDDCYMGTRAKGLYLRNCQKVSLNRHWHIVPNECLNIDESVLGVHAWDCFWETGTTASLAGQKMVWSIPKTLSNTALPRSFILEPA
jgi:hypothetical protein